ncbi:hypothetical protein EDC01DRAFT_634311 [Geopyxis carbonaria]|nr:hypothetical protein EDC01DRAFT_634311 [Geopyxis carbonaria]
MAAAAARAASTPPTPSPPRPPPPAPVPPPQQPVGPRTRASFRGEILLAGRRRVAAAIAAGAATTAANPIPARRGRKRVDWGIKVFRDAVWGVGGGRSFNARRRQGDGFITIFIKLHRSLGAVPFARGRDRQAGL